jgi:NitT/TauT family transport system substrate-binding protein
LDRHLASYEIPGQLRGLKASALAIALVIAVACGGPGGGAAPAASSGPPEKASLKIAVGGQNQIGYLPLTLADQLGYYREAGLSVELDDVGLPTKALEALRSGSADVVCGPYEQTLHTQVLGDVVQMFTVFDEYPALVMMVGKPHQAQVASIKDLVGHPVGVTLPFSATDEMVKYLLKRNGLAIDAIPVVAIGSGSTAISAIQSGQVWAGVTIEPAATALEKSGNAKALYDTRSAQGSRDVFGGTWPTGGLYASPAFITKNPRTIQALARAAVKALRYIHTHSAGDIAGHVPATFYAGLDRHGFVDTLKADLGQFSADGLMPADGPGNVFDTLKTADPRLDWASVDLRKSYDNRYVQNVK